MSAHWDYPRNVCSVRVLTEVAAGHGMTVAECLHGTRVDSATLQDHGAMVGACDELQVIRNLQARLGTSLPLALEAGLRYHPTTFGVWGFMILSSGTLQQAVEVGMRYLRLTSFYSRIRLVDNGDELFVVAEDSELPADVRDFLVERDGATLMNLAQDILPLKFSLTRVDARREKPPYARRAEALFGRPIVYGQTENRVGLNKAMLGWKLPQADLPMRRMFEAECERLLQRHQTLAGIAGRVRERLLRDPHRMPTMETVAAEFKETARTLRRRLDAAGTRFENLVEETRQTLAEELLRGTNLAISEVAERLGYSEPSTFIRAFKRWKSISPQRFRKSG
ncbi:AraC family transcriptional regulator [Solimonas sp. K1W22B-7]|uniref:AraC family transcriptional regulator n=1 Tax=Solimonas sp. K1W22B-7 TaxID=2303331 RepID=UPI000E33766E|nr:AraC family transcriptional regulator [Solimonas sp. K1W22B-7]AXQ29157.1 AraC family transcriptional regulator [Solimonas sp. K1W22B-7]